MAHAHVPQDTPLLQTWNTLSLLSRKGQRHVRFLPHPSTTLHGPYYIPAQCGRAHTELTLIRAPPALLYNPGTPPALKTNEPPTRASCSRFAHVTTKCHVLLKSRGATLPQHSLGAHHSQFVTRTGRKKHSGEKLPSVRNT